MSIGSKSINHAITVIRGVQDLATELEAGYPFDPHAPVETQAVDETYRTIAARLRRILDGQATDPDSLT